MKRSVREVGHLNHTPMLSADIRYGLRALARNPVYTAAVVATLALGIGANAVVLAVADAVFLRPLPFAHAERLVKVFVTHQIAGGGVGDFAASNFDFAAFTQRNRTLSGIGGIQTQTLSVAGRAATPQTVRGGLVTASLWSVLGVRPVAGRTFTPGEDVPDGAVAVIAETLQRRLLPGPARDAVGKSLIVDGRARTIVGVMPAGFEPILIPSEVWIPLGIPAAPPARGPGRFLELVGRLRPGVTAEQARADVARIARELEAEQPDTHRDYGASAAPLREKIGDDVQRPVVLTLLGAVASLLLLACANVSNLALVRATRRRADLATRIALGAPWGSILRQQLVESAIVGLAGGAIGTALAAAVLPRLLTMVSSDDELLTLAVVDWRVLLVVFGLSLVVGVGCGAGPAVYGAGAAARSVAGGVRRGRGGRADAYLGRLLMAGQVAAAAVLLVAAIGMAATLHRLSRTDLGFRADGVVAAAVTLPSARYPGITERAALVRDVTGRLAATPGFRAVGLTSNPFVRGQVTKSMVTIEGQESGTDPRRAVELRRVAGSYFAALGIAVLRGRDFTDADRDSTLPVAIVSRAFVREYLAGAEALGLRVRRGPPTNPWLTIVGVVPDVMDRGVGVDVGPALYVPYAQSSSPEATFVLATSLDPTGVERAVRAAVGQVDATLAVDRVEPLGRLVDDWMGEDRFKATIVYSLAALAVLLTVTGIYGVTAFLVEERARDVAVRMALGARARTVVSATILEGTRWILVAACAGLTASRALGALVEHYVPRFADASAATYVGAGALLVLVGAAACAIPSWRVARISPARVLRAD